MARYSGPVCKFCRRERMKLFLKGYRCDSPKCAMQDRAYPPGEHPFRRGKTGEYAMQLREKQRAKRVYGVLDAQFRRYFREALQKKGNTGEHLLLSLERRLDNVMYRSGLAASRAQARQMIRHGWIRVNGRKTDIPSYGVRLGDVLTVRDAEPLRKAVKDTMDLTRQRERPTWLDIAADPPVVKVLRLPARDEVSMPVEEQLIVEFSSK
ncbi:MAG: 30S ribosomal protein S4 [Planctomycetota bacterium]